MKGLASREEGWYMALRAKAQQSRLRGRNVYDGNNQRGVYSFREHAGWEKGPTNCS